MTDLPPPSGDTEGPHRLAEVVDRTDPNYYCVCGAEWIMLVGACRTEYAPPPSGDDDTETRCRYWPDCQHLHTDDCLGVNEVAP